MLLLALLLHLLVLRALPWGVGDGWRGGVRERAPPVMSTRLLVAGPMVSPPAPAVAPLSLPAPRASATRAAARQVSAPARDAETAPEAALPAPAAAQEDGGQQVPIFATRLAPSVALAYELRRGGLSGDATLLWRPRADGYTLSMQATALGLPFLAWASQGGFDAAGIAPERFVDRRRSRDVRAANFQRDKERISFSSSTREFALIAGAQDRLSWMLQLPAIVDAAPEVFVAGTQIPVFVVTARGDADVWVFTVQGHEALELPAGHIERTLHLLREPRRPYDTRVEVWLDPAQHHLPLRMRLATAQTGDANDFVLKQLSWLTP